MVKVCVPVAVIVRVAAGVAPNAPVETKTSIVAESLPCPSDETFTTTVPEFAPADEAVTDAITGGV